MRGHNGWLLHAAALDPHLSIVLHAFQLLRQRTLRAFQFLQHVHNTLHGKTFYVLFQLLHGVHVLRSSISCTGWVISHADVTAFVHRSAGLRLTSSPISLIHRCCYC